MRPQTTLRNALNLRVTDDTLGWLMSAASQAKIPPSVLARKVLEDAAKRDLQQGHGDEDEQR